MARMEPMHNCGDIGYKFHFSLVRNKNCTLFQKRKMKFKSRKLSTVSKQAIKKQSVCNEWLFTQA